MNIEDLNIDLIKSINSVLARHGMSTMPDDCYKFTLTCESRTPPNISIDRSLIGKTDKQKGTS
jgi:hypothetical protein